MDGRTPEQIRKETLAKLLSSSVSLQNELEDLLKILRFQRETLTNEMVSGMAYRQQDLSESLVTKTSKLTLAYEKALSAKIRLDKHLKDAAAEMTPDEELESVKKYIIDLDSMVRRGVIIDLLNYHNTNVTNTAWYIRSE